MEIHEIEPASHRRETKGVLLVALIIAGLWALFVAVGREQAGPAVLEEHQQSAFADLEALEQGLFNDLLAAIPEIQGEWRESGEWPEPSILDEEGLPPFTQDLIWRKRGRMVWTRVVPDADATIYWGRPQDAGVAEWLLAWSDGVFSIWRRPIDPMAREPRFPEAQLIRNGWKEVIARNPISQ